LDGWGMYDDSLMQKCAHLCRTAAAPFKDLLQSQQMYVQHAYGKFLFWMAL